MQFVCTKKDQICVRYIYCVYSIYQNIRRHNLNYSWLILQRQYHMSSSNTSICPTFHFLTSRCVSFRRLVSLISTLNCHKDSSKSLSELLNNDVLKSITQCSPVFTKYIHHCSSCLPYVTLDKDISLTLLKS